MTSDERASLRALCEAATPGPWSAGPLRRECDHPTTSLFAEERYLFPPLGESGPVALACEAEFANAALIAAARTALPALLDALDAAERERDEARAKVRALRSRLFDAWCDRGSPGSAWDALDMTEAEYREWIGEPATKDDP